MKILKTGGSREKGKEEAKSIPHAHVITTTTLSHCSQFLYYHYYCYKSLITVFVLFTTTA